VARSEPGGKSGMGASRALWRWGKPALTQF